MAASEAPEAAEGSRFNLLRAKLSRVLIMHVGHEQQLNWGTRVNDNRCQVVIAARVEEMSDNWASMKIRSQLGFSQ